MNDISLRDHIDLLIKAEHALNEEKIAALYREIETATSVLNHRLQAMNEFRDQINKERQDYVRKDWIEGQLRFIGTLITTVSGIITFLINLWMR